MVIAPKMSMTIKHNELIFIYNRHRFKEKEAYAYAKSLPNYQLREMDVSEESLTPTQLEFIKRHCKCKFQDLVREPLNTEADADWKNLNKTDFLEWLSKHPNWIKTPIVLWEDSGKILKNKYSLVNEGLELNQVKIDHHENENA